MPKVKEPPSPHAMPTLNRGELQTRVNELLNRWPAVGLAVGVVRDGRLAFFHGHGLADIASHTPITEDTAFRIASITKTVTAIAIMQLWEHGLVDLDAPANNYLRAYQLVPKKASFRPATVRHLLTHTAGVPQVLHPSDWLLSARGENVPFGQPVPALAEYYRAGVPLVTEPGTRFTYGDHGFATLGQLVEDVSGQSLNRYLREHIFEPLGMLHTDLVRSERVQARLATGYLLGSGGVKALADYEVVTAGAGAIYSTPGDMARYVAALVGGGANAQGAVLKPATLATMFAPHFQTDPRVAGMGLAFFRADVDGHLAVWHEGAIQGYNAQIWLAPDDGVGVLAFTNSGTRGAATWLLTAASGLLRQVLGVPDEGLRTEVPQHPERWADLCGWYRLSAQWTDLQSRSLAGLGAEVFIHRGQLMIRVLSPLPMLYRGFALHPDDEQDTDVFRIDLRAYALGAPRVVFSRDARASAARVHVDIVPLWLEKQPDSTNPRRWTTGTVGMLGVLGAVGVAAGTGRAVRRRRATRRPHQRAESD